MHCSKVLNFPNDMILKHKNEKNVHFNKHFIQFYALKFYHLAENFTAVQGNFIFGRKK